MPSVADMVAELHANIEPFRQGMRDAVSVANTTSTGISNALGSIEGTLGSIANTGARLSGVIGLLGRISIIGGAIYATYRSVAGTLSSISDIARGADAAGITTGEYQELAFAADRAGISQAEFSKQIAHFADVAHQAKGDQGALFDELTKYNAEALKAVKSSISVSGAMAGVAEAVRAAAGEQERAAIITAAFGENNAELRRLLMGGASGLDEAAAKARELGVVFDDNLVRQAPEIEEKFTALVHLIGSEFQNALVQAAPGVVTLAGAMADLLQVVTLSIDGWSKLITEIRALSDYGEIASRATSSITLQIRDMRTEIEKLQSEINTQPGFLDKLFGEDVLAKHQRMMTLIGEVTKLESELQRRGWSAALETTPTFRQAAAPAAPEAATAGGSAGAGSASRALALLDRIETDFLRATKNTTELLQVEYQRQLDALEKNLADGLIAAEDYTKARAELEQTLTTKLAAEALKQVKPISDAISGTLSRAFDNFIEKGQINFRSFADMMIKELARVAFQMSIIQPLFGGGSTPGGGIIGNALAGIFHQGGVVGQGGGVRSVPGLAFAIAPRFHGGGFPGMRAGEVPAILERGETVLPKGMRGMGGGRPIVVNIQTPDVESFRRSEGQIASMLTRAVSRGQRNM